MTPEDRARKQIDSILEASGWIVQSRAAINLSTGRGAAIREASLRKGRGETDYLLFADGKAIATVEAKPEGWTLTGVEEQYGKGLLEIYPSWGKPRMHRNAFLKELGENFPNIASQQKRLKDVAPTYCSSWIKDLKATLPLN
jgi:hypothetical protein